MAVLFRPKRRVTPWRHNLLISKDGSAGSRRLLRQPYWASSQRHMERKLFMCTMIVEKIKVDGSGKGTSGWFKLEQASVSYDHPFHAPLEHALNIDFLNESQGLGARVAVELSEQAARDLVRTILAVLDEAGRGGHLESQL
jgi:hypothetical protein